MQIQSKIISTRISFLSQKICTMIPFAIGMVDVSFLKKLEERPEIKDQNTTRVRHNGLIIMECPNSNYNFALISIMSFRILRFIARTWPSQRPQNSIAMG